MPHRGPSARIQTFPLALLVLSIGLGSAGPLGAAAGQPCTPPDYLPPARALAECNGGFADPARLAAVFARGLGLDGATARRLAEAMARSEALQKRLPNEVSLPAIRDIESEFIILLKGAPASGAIRQEATWFYADWGRSLGTPSPALYDLIAAAPDPTALVLQLADDKVSSEPLFLDVILAGLEVRPGQALLWERAERFTGRPAARIAFLAEALRTLLAGAPAPPPADLPIAAALATARIEAELDAGLPERAVATFRALPPAVRSWLEEGARGVVQAVQAPPIPRSPAAGLPFRRELHDLRPDLALAFLLVQDRDAAAAMVRRLDATPARTQPAGLAPPPTLDEEDRRRPAADLALRRRLAARWLAPSPDDPFDFFREACENGALASVRDRLAVARLAERESYPAVAAYALRTAGRELAYEPPGESRSPGRAMPGHLRAAIAALEAEIAERRKSFEDEATAVARASLGPDPAAPSVARALAAPFPAVFAEHPLPAGVLPLAPSPPSPPTATTPPTAPMPAAAKAGGKDPAALTLPQGFAAVRSERSGGRAVAIGVSQDYDPVGQVSPGAYWVILSSDDGRTWSRPLYTGLRVTQPYVVRAASNLPLLAGDRLDVEVEVRELDATKITFPPVALAPKRTATGLYLEIPLAELRRDTDGDGLTDLAEARLLTDPRNPDTDGDGLPDGVDPLPLVPRGRASSPASEALAALLAKISGVGWRTIGDGASPPPPAAERTAFLVGDRALFASLDPDRRVIVLTEVESEAAMRRRLGALLPLRLDLFVLDRIGRRGYALWSSSSEGGALDLKQESGRWVATERSTWIYLTD
jgi:hypothetical protein